MKPILHSLLVLSLSSVLNAVEPPRLSYPAPLFELRNQLDKPFKLADRKGKGWTVLFFYPKAGTPGCTKQACAFRDSIKVIRKLNAEVYGVSADTVADQAKFHKEHRLTFDLLADPKAEAISRFGAKFEDSTLAKRWTFILDPELKVRWKDDKVDPVMDAQKVADALKELKPE